jgi:hypothetical protein
MAGIDEQVDLGEARAAGAPGAQPVEAEHRRVAGQGVEDDLLLGRRQALVHQLRQVRVRIRTPSRAT